MARNAPLPGCFTSLVQEFQDLPELQGLAPQAPSPLPRRSGIQAACPRAGLPSCPSLPPGCPPETHASARSTIVLMSSQRRAESLEQFCRIHNLRSVTTCGRRGWHSGTQMCGFTGEPGPRQSSTSATWAPQDRECTRSKVRWWGVREPHLVIPTSARVQLPRSFTDELLGAERGRGSWSAQAGPGASQPCHLPSLPLGPAISAEATCSDIQPAGNRRMVLMLQGAMGEGEGGGQVDSRGSYLQTSLVGCVNIFIIGV